MNRSLRGRISYPATLLALGLAFGGGCADTSQPQSSQPQTARPKAGIAIRSVRPPAALDIPADARPMKSPANLAEQLALSREASGDVAPAAGITTGNADGRPRGVILGIAPAAEATSSAVREPVSPLEVAQRPTNPPSAAVVEGPELTTPAQAPAPAIAPVPAAPAKSEEAPVNTYQGLPPIMSGDEPQASASQPLYESAVPAPSTPASETVPDRATAAPFTPAEIPIEPSSPATSPTPPVTVLGNQVSAPRPMWRLEDPALQTAPPAQHLAGYEPPAARPPHNIAARQAVVNRATELVRHSYTLAQRGAHYSARAELIQALRLVAQANDAERPEGEHSQALARGLQALREADDFAPRGSRLEGQLDVAQIVITHRTPVLKGQAVGNLSPLVALQRYYSYAQQQFASAGGNMPAASQALYGLGRIQTLLADGTSESQRLQSPRAMTYYQAALLVDGGNYLAANELGVMLADYGQLAEARRVLLHSVMTHSHVEGWQNLAVVHARLGEHDLSHRADFDRQLLVAQREKSGGDSPLTKAVQWVDPQAFAAGGAADPTAPSPVATATRPGPATDVQHSGNIKR
jgi:hypothetical protein